MKKEKGEKDMTRFRGSGCMVPWIFFLNISYLKASIWCILRETSSTITRHYECMIKYLYMVTLCYIRNETDNFCLDMRNSTTLIAQFAAKSVFWQDQHWFWKSCCLSAWKKGAGYSVLMRWPAPFSCALLFDSVPAVHRCPCLHG